MSSPSARFSSSSRSMRSIKDFSCAPAIPPTSGIIPSPPVVMLPPQQGRDDSLRARMAQGREANLPKPIEVWGTGEAWTGRPCEGPRVQTCPAYRRRATPYSTLEPRHERAQRPHDDRGGRGGVVPAVHIARDGIGLADRAIETRESGAIRRNRIRPAPWRLHRRAWFGLSPVRGNRLDRRLCSANVIMEPRWRPAKQRCPDPATALALILVGGRSDGPYRGRSRMLFVSRGTQSSQTLRWREMDSNFRFRCVRRS